MQALNILSKFIVAFCELFIENPLECFLSFHLSMINWPMVEQDTMLRNQKLTRKESKVEESRRKK